MSRMDNPSQGGQKNESGGQGQSVGQQIRDKASDMGQSIRDMGGKAKEAASEQMNQLRDSANEYYQQGREKAMEYYEQGRERATEMEQDLENYIREQPIKSVMIAAGVGMLLGILWRRS